MALLQYRSISTWTRGHFNPCPALGSVQVVFYSDQYHDTEMMAASRRMFDLAGVRAWQHTTAVPHVLVNFEAVR